MIVQFISKDAYNLLRKKVHTKQQRAIIGHRYDGSTKDASFSIGLQGIGKEDVDRVTEIIHSTFDKTIEYVGQLCYFNLEFYIMVIKQRH